MQIASLHGQTYRECFHNSDNPFVTTVWLCLRDTLQQPSRSSSRAFIHRNAVSLGAIAKRA